jgi:hydroxyethylthiazole kinase-like uncharacterized protein yjeF
VTALYFTETIRHIERLALSRLPVGELMRRAAHVVAFEAQRLLKDLPSGTPTLALVGPGNNGADALLALQILRDRGYLVHAISLSGNPPQSPEGQAVWHSWSKHGGRMISAAQASQWLAAHPLVIDGLFGIGLTRALDAEAAQLIKTLNACPVSVIAVDVPSGIDADRGSIVGGAEAVAVRADVTVTMIADKPGLHTGASLDHVGHLIVAPLDLDPLLELQRAERQDRTTASRDARKREMISLFDETAARALLGPRLRNTNKGSFGAVSVIGGAQGTAGAALLAARGAAAAGAGKVFIASPDGVLFDAGQPNLMTRQLEDALAGVTAVCLGCGLGVGEVARRIVQQALNTDLPLLIDADALNLIAQEPDLRCALRTRAAVTILTPHPLEAARLLTQPVARIQADRIDHVRQLAKDLDCIVLLKGAGTLIADPHGRVQIIASGSPALATAGTGDVLAGVISALLAQHREPQEFAWQAAALGAWLHGAAGERWQADFRHGIGLRAQDLPQLIIDLINNPEQYARTCHR